MSNLNIKSLLIAVVVLLSVTNIYAQDTKSKNIGNEDITIVKEYQPVVNDAFKIGIPLEGDSAEAKPVKLLYNVNPAPLGSSFNITPIKPVRIKDDSIKKLYHGFVKAGYGLENMPLLDVSLTSLRSKDYEGGFEYHHLSSTGKIKDYGDPNNSRNRLTAYGTKYFKRFSIGATIDYNRRVVHYYGYPSPPEIFSKSETKHLMNDFEGGFKFNSLSVQKDDWKYNGGISFYTYSDNRSSNENNTHLNFGTGKILKDAFLGIQASFDAMSVSQDSISFKRSIFSICPMFTVTRERYSFELGTRLYNENNGGKNNLRLYPVAKGTYELADNELTVFAELSGDLQRNDIRSLARENPFTYGILPLANTNKKIELKGGSTILIAHGLMFNFTASYAALKNMPFYVNVYNANAPVTFTAFYDKGSRFSIETSIDYKFNEKIKAGAVVNYNQYNLDSLQKPLYVPLLKTGINIMYNLADKITARIDMFLNSRTNANAYTQDGKFYYTNLKSYADANISVDYRYTKLLSVFISINNIAFSQYFRYYNYPSYRFNGMIGATLSF